MIRFEKVTKIYLPESAVLQDVSFEVKKGEFVSIVGKSGAGKSTLIKMILGLEEPTYGDVFFNGENIHKVSHNELQNIRRKIGAVYQDYKLLPAKTVYENVAYIMEIEGRVNEDIALQVPRVLAAIGLKEKMDNFPEELSGGEQQRLAIARALAGQPEVIIADEPTGNLDPYNSHEVLALLEKINRSGKTVILATHDREIVNKLARRVITIEDGRVVRDEEKGRFII
ncbi:MAG TPA: cell division ATP-binding protein FtsE [Negativicutes bacterium]|uniref:Cell division ATP-binding protein FtsE n=1 Tax=Candidatus Staskawiczbacteria bacterium RIFCSPHIGHO2_01_FULL_41_41 TaxID=1802203 RepID=A0A1G2HTL2_9BACT|nr:MAG: cell division ATP-binding protein FtsE [Candidatus Staskawiczbacteria bacterium RIFCSPHIGHO2_01_FULL_41_41]OGZ68306.1 MAG: cell division ATP-binding protein FtsE [Candidatus Staskawiczbacteria bacterium RIFCSPHIGHO2_02_FULL_43_16]OGZ75097.1 MAG: cell division ATP-binding protein FtsE [Candidatus Staskawiczbacteria bacterium RIFCSPLOWO2_01_FULL_43_17b]HLD70563.1 cell division ATP-binding protein FtsE [Negativicutes bacterium]